MAFGGILRQSTAVDVLIGPFLDETTGKDAETGLSPDVELSKNGQALANKNDATTPTHDSAGDVDGYYNCELDATDTNTVGILTLVCHPAGTALPIRLDYQVIEEGIYDALFAGSAVGFDANQRVNVGQWLSQAVTLSTGNKPDVNIDEISDDATAAANLESACDNYSATRGLAGTALPAAVAGAAGGLPTDSAGKTSFNDLSAAQVNAECDTALSEYDAVVPADLPANFADLSITITTGRVDVASIEGGDATDAIRDAVVDDSTRIDASALNTLSGHDPGSTLAAQTDVTGLNNLSAAEVNAQVDAALVDINLDHLLAVATAGADMTTEVVDNSIVSRILAAGDTSAFVPGTDSLQNVRDELVVVDGNVDSILADTGTDGVVLADGAITAAKIAADAITEAKIADDAIAAEHIAAGALVAASFAANAIDANALAADAVTEIWAKTGAGSAVTTLLMLDRIYMRLAHKVIVTDADGSLAIRNAGDTGDAGTGSITDNDTYTIQTKVTWA